MSLPISNQGIYFYPLQKVEIINNQGFIRGAQAVHGNKENYDKVDYKNKRCLLIIECPISGEFI